MIDNKIKGNGICISKKINPYFGFRYGGYVKIKNFKIEKVAEKSNDCGPVVPCYNLHESLVSEIQNNQMISDYIFHSTQLRKYTKMIV